MAQKMGLSAESIKKGLQSFKGVKRRFEYIFEAGGKVYIDDYAHHPRELEACIQSLRQLFPERKITGIFQPHLFSRTRDFAEGFAESLGLLDELMLMEIYPARELPIPGINSTYLLELVAIENKKLAAEEIAHQKIIEQLKTSFRRREVQEYVDEHKDELEAETPQRHSRDLKGPANRTTSWR
jgi:UDP-N-acetylmuramate--alanine ligase